MKILKLDLNELDDDELEAYLILKRAMNKMRTNVPDIPEEDEVPDELPEPPEFSDDN